MSASNRLIVSILAVAALAIAFWMLALGPKREQADELSSQAEQLHASLTEAQSKVAEAIVARREFPADYRQLVTLGQAVPADDETSSLLVELNQVATASKVKFDGLQLSSEGETAPTTTTPAPAPETPPSAPAEGSTGAVPAATTIPPTEAAASLLPLGASIGPAGLDVMPYNLTFSGDFFHIADFIKGIDSLVHAGGSRVAVDGRLVTLDAFALSANAEKGFPHLDATFSVTTYLTPPEQGVTAGATSTAPPAITTPAGASAAATESTAAETTAPESPPAEEAQ
jgi:Tfp pilus assembly protein PilO